MNINIGPRCQGKLNKAGGICFISIYGICVGERQRAYTHTGERRLQNGTTPRTPGGVGSHSGGVQCENVTNGRSAPRVRSFSSVCITPTPTSWAPTRPQPAGSSRLGPQPLGALGLCVAARGQRVRRRRFSPFNTFLFVCLFVKTKTTHRMACLGRDLEDHLAPNPVHQIANGPILVCRLLPNTGPELRS